VVPSAQHKLYIEATPTATALFKKAIELRNAVLVEALVSLVGFLSKDEVLVYATAAPKFFLDHVLKKLQASPDLTRTFREVMVDIFFDPTQTMVGAGAKAQETQMERMRATLKAALGAEWVTFAKTVPVLALAENAREHFAGAGVPGGKQPSWEEVVNEIFRAFIKNEGINIGYFAGSKDPTEKIMMGNGGGLSGSFAGAPAVLRTQCDDIMKILREAVRAYPNLKIDYGIGMEKQALLTKPLNTLPGGLIPNSFTGNVIDRSGNFTNQIFFTGVTDSKVPNSHTWLTFNGKPYDAVLGTSGSGVAASKQAAFTQVQEGVWEDGSGHRITRQTIKPPAANPMGFGSGYLLVNIAQEQRDQLAQQADTMAAKLNGSGTMDDRNGVDPSEWEDR